jgi:ABC-type amino acid transport substrate-binding protein
MRSVLLALLFLTALVAAQTNSTGNAELQQAINAALGTYINSGQWATDITSILGTTLARTNDCSSFPSYPSSPTAGGALARVVNNGVLRIGYSTAPPYGNTSNGGIDGIMDNYFCTKLSAQYGKTISCQFNGMASTTALLSALTSGTVDIVTGGLTRNPSREVSRAFTIF